jgi:hypothetical protein
MTIAKCKECIETIITTESLKDKKNVICINCIFKYFNPSKVDNYIICKECGVAVKTLNEANEHLKDCSTISGYTKEKEVRK